MNEARSKGESAIPQFRLPRRRLLASFLASTILCACAAPMARGPVQGGGGERPDVVLIVFDDLGFSDLGCFGSQIATPNIDALAAAGLRYTGVDSKAICSPSRASLLTGRNTHTVNMPDLAAEEITRKQTAPGDVVQGVMPEGARTLAEGLRDVGYATFAMGKWHLEPEWEDGTEGNNAHFPLQMGFDRFYGFRAGWADQYRPDLYRQNAPIGQPQDPDYHLSAALVDESISAIDNVAQADPYFLYLAFGATHAPLQVPREYADRYAGRFDRGWDVLREERLARMKSLGIMPADAAMTDGNSGDRRWADLSDDERKVYARYMEIYAGFLTHADEQIGRLVDHLKRTGRYDNTIFMLVSDNGGAAEAGQTGSFGHLYPPRPANAAVLVDNLDALLETHIEYQRPWAMLSDTPFRRYKSWPYLGGVRVPMVVAWPAGIAPRGEIRRQSVDFVDLAPTIADLAGADLAHDPAGRPVLPVAGQSIAPTFGSNLAADPRPVQYFELRGNRAIRVGKWRAVGMHRPGTRFEDDRWELFDLSSDPAETNDLAQRFPDRLRMMQTAWQEEAERFGALPLSQGPAYLRSRYRYDDSFTGERKEGL